MRIKLNNGQRVFFTSDLHYNHQQEFVWKSRGHDNSEDHNESLITTINDTVGENDLLFNLGDFTLNCPIEVFKEFIRKINCQNIHMLWGNHPNPHFKQIYKKLVTPILKDSYSFGKYIYPVRYQNIIFQGDYLEITVDNQLIVMFHYPMISWKNSQNGTWALVGHEHGACPETLPEYKKGKILDVGWDIHKKPLSFEEVSKIMENKEIKEVGHHVLQ